MRVEALLRLGFFVLLGQAKRTRRKVEKEVTEMHRRGKEDYRDREVKRLKRLKG